MSVHTQQRTGLAAALTAFLIWGGFPLYFNIIDGRVSAWEILLMRILWSVPFLAVLIYFTHRSGAVRQAFREPRIWGALCLSTTFITINWGTFIWAVTNGYILQASLGYYINPLLNVCLGMIVFKERLRPLQWMAVLLAALGVSIMVVGYGQVPWIAFILATTFACYGLIRKQVKIDSASGLFIETLLLMPFALIWLLWMYKQGEAGFLRYGMGNDLLLIGLGIITVIPLMCFAVGARLLRLGTLGLTQYITPTLQFLTGVFIFHEAFSTRNAITFVLIWVGLAIYTGDILHTQRRLNRARHQQHRFTTRRDVQEYSAPDAAQK